MAISYETVQNKTSTELVKIDEKGVTNHSQILLHKYYEKDSR